MQKPSLPSIQFMLHIKPEDTPIKDKEIIARKPKRQHRQSNSMSSLPSELQQLSLSAPAYIPEKSENNQPSWMMMMPTRSPSHARSISELPPLPVIRNRHQTHRRSVSANTPNLTLFHNQEIRAHTDSPPAGIDEAIPDSTSTEQLFDALNIKKEKKYDTVMVARDEQTGRYYCPFCNKAFNRPSSLRIHTYSHTGEKPFACQEEGCGRQFSVQSNMRRHLRVHKLGRSKATKSLP